MKISISPISVHGNRRYMVRWRPPGQKRQKKFFKTKTDAESHAEELRHQQNIAGEAWLSLTAAQRAELMQLHDEALKDGHSLRAALDHLKTDKKAALPPKTVSQAYTDFVAEKKLQRLAHRSLLTIRSNVGRFVKGYGYRQLGSITRADGMEWLKQYADSPRSFNSNLGRLKTFFAWAASPGVGHLMSNPFASISLIDESRLDDLDEEPKILSFEQCKSLLKAALDVDKKLASYAALCLFAGMRPEREAANVGKTAIMERNDGTGAVVSEILVKGKHAKDRQRRLISAHITLVKWLKLGGDMPPKNLRRRWERVREAAGLIRREKVPGKKRYKVIHTGWHQDCLRHTFASCWLVLFGADSTIQQLGHGDYDMLFGHYRALMTREVAAQIFSLTPAAVSSAA